MNKDQAFAVLNASFACGSDTWVAPEHDRATYIANKSQQLLGCVIDPVKVTIQGEMFHYGVHEKLSQSQLRAIAHQDGRWLIYSPDQDVFALGFGESATRLTVLGFASGDALAEWLG
ncbi:hypothetical protein [Vogesella sp. LIG4]|uniref:hypothetical protein n=1 Tax=Vogesella sp. LIG4 TaxID=1192162 RepID=UPI0012FE4327|nr:hypothetical protein [Vogesella sp. LIG4]